MDEYPEGLDVEWIAVDRVGRLGVFTTGGSGPMPNAYLKVPGSLERIWNAIRALPEITDCDLVVSLPRPDDFVMFARRGLFSFDWADVHRRRVDETHRYEMQARPTHALIVDNLSWSTDLRELLEEVRSPLLDFTNTSVDVVAALECAAEPAVAADGASPRRRTAGR